MARDDKNRFRENLEPLVSVICITRNHERFCVEALDSVLNQTYKNIEWIILDAASTDNTVEIIDNWLVENNADAVFLKEKDLKSITVNLNKALAYAHGEYLQILSLDDVLQNEKLEQQIKIFQSIPYLGLLLSNAIRFNELAETGRYTQTDSNRNFENYSNKELSELFLEHNYFCAPGALIKLDALNHLQGFDENLFIEDTDMWFRFCISDWLVKYQDIVHVKYREHSTSFWHNVNHKIIIGYFQFYVKHKLKPSIDTFPLYLKYFQKAPVKDKWLVFLWLIENRSFYLLKKYICFTASFMITSIYARLIRKIKNLY